MTAILLTKLREIGLRPTKQRVKICELLYFIEKKHFILQLIILAKKISK